MISDEKLVAAGWRTVSYLSAVGGGAGTLAVLSALALAPWWAVLGWSLACVTGFLASDRVIATNVKLLLKLHENSGKNALDAEDDE